MSVSQHIELKCPEEIKIMDQGARIALGILTTVASKLKTGLSTQDVDNLIKQEVEKHQVKPAFLDYKIDNSSSGFPSYACLSLNEEVFHTPASSSKILNPGDLLTMDFGIIYKDLYADVANTYCLGNPSPEKRRLIATPYNAILAALPYCKPGCTTKDLTKVMEALILKEGFYPVPNFGGHGIGTSLHMPPFIANVSQQATNCDLTPGMVICIEPAVSMYAEDPQTASDNWTVVLRKGNLSSHSERMIEVTSEGGRILGL